MVTRRPLRRSASAASTPMYPAPTTTALFGLLLAEEAAHALRVIQRVQGEDVRQLALPADPAVRRARR